jgi:ribosomal protein S6--L-glutamate ligase
VDEAVDAVKRFGRVVAKPLFTSKARGMAVIGDGPDVHERVQAFRDAGNPMMYLQKLLALPGHDLGVVFLGGKYVTTYARAGSSGSWNTTVRDGGRYVAYDPPDELIELAWCAQAPFGLDFTCVDVAETEFGPMVWEVSAFGGFRGLQDARGMDAAELYVSYVLKMIGARA